MLGGGHKLWVQSEVVAKVLNIKEGLGDTGDINIDNIQVSNKGDKSVCEGS